jgi:hypothetical protein
MTIDVRIVKCCVRTGTLQLKDRILFYLPQYNLYFLLFSFDFLLFYVDLSGILMSFHPLLSFSAFCLHSRYFALSFLLFSLFLTVRILGLFLEYFLDK